MKWSFGIVNKKLSEVYYERKKRKTKFIGHCYVKEAEYKTKTEQRWIKEDTENLRLIYRKGEYIEIEV